MSCSRPTFSNRCGGPPRKSSLSPATGGVIATSRPSLTWRERRTRRPATPIRSSLAGCASGGAFRACLPRDASPSACACIQRRAPARRRPSEGRRTPRGQPLAARQIQGYPSCLPLPPEGDEAVLSVAFRCVGAQTWAQRTRADRHSLLAATRSRPGPLGHDRLGICLTTPQACELALGRCEPTGLLLELRAALL